MIEQVESQLLSKDERITKKVIYNAPHGKLVRDKAAKPKIDNVPSDLGLVWFVLFSSTWSQY